MKSVKYVFGTLIIIGLGFAVYKGYKAWKAKNQGTYSSAGGADDHVSEINVGSRIAQGPIEL